MHKEKTLESPASEYSPPLQSVHVATDNEVAPGHPYLPAAHIVPAQVDAPVVSKIVKESVMNECANLLSFDNKVTDALPHARARYLSLPLLGTPSQPIDAQMSPGQ